MKIILVLLAISLLVEIEAVGRGRTKYRGRQLPFPGQPDATEEPWPHASIQKVDRRQDSWQDGAESSAIEDLDEAIVVGDGEMPVPESPNTSRQFYPGWIQSAAEIPKPITPVAYPTQQATNQEGGGLAQPPQQTIYPTQQPANPSQQPSYPMSQQPANPSQQATFQPSHQPSNPPQQPTYAIAQQPSNLSQQPTYPVSQQPSNLSQQPQQPANQPSQQSPSPNPTLPPGCLGPRGQYPSPNNCANYLNCWDDVVIEQSCLNGLLFNDVTGLCDFEYNVNCGDRPGATPKPSLPAGTKRCPDLHGRYRSATNCSEFYVCLSGSPIKFSCPRGLVYNDAVNVCDYTYNVDCQGAATPKPLALPRPEQPSPSISGLQGSNQVQQTQRPQVTFPPSAYPDNSWLARDADGNERSEVVGVSSANQLVEADSTEIPTVQSPWDMMHSLPEEMAKVPCENGSVHRLDESCRSVVVCRNKRPRLVQCPSGFAYDRPSDSCLSFNLAKC